MSELDSGSKDDEDLGVKEENAADFKDFNDPPNNDETKKPEANLQIVDGGEMISPNDSDSEQNSTELDKNNANTELEDTSEKRHSPVVWEGNNDVDTVRVDTPENDFSRESEDEHSKDNKAREIRTTNESFAPASSEIMDPDVLNNFDQLFINTKYFLIKSNNYENVVIAKENNAWSTPVGNEHRLNKAFDESNNVILIFSVRESGKFQGFARIASPPDSRLKINWVLPPRMNPDMLSHPFKLDWITKQELPFNNVAHLTNSWNEGKLVKIGRDGQEIEPVCGQALCRSFPLDSAEMISEIVKKIVPKNPKSADGNRRRNLSDRIGTTTDRIRRPKDLGFHNPSSVGLLGNATSSRPPTVPPLMSSIDLSSAVAAMAALKSNHQPRGSLLQTTSPAIDISHFAAPAVLPNLIPQPTGPDPTAFSTLLNTHAPAINRIFNPQDINQQRQHPLSGRERRYRSRSSSRESSGRYRRDYRRRYAEEGEDDYYRDFRSRYSREDSGGRHYAEDHRECRRSRDRSSSPSRENPFLHWNYEDYLKEVQRGMNPNLSSLINGVVQPPRVHGPSDADRQFDEQVNAFLRNATGPPLPQPPVSALRYSDELYRRDYERDYDSRSRSSSSTEERYYRRRHADRRSRERGSSRHRTYGDLRRSRYEHDMLYQDEGGDHYYEHHRRSSGDHGRSRSRIYRRDEDADYRSGGDDYREGGVRGHHSQHYRR